LPNFRQLLLPTAIGQKAVMADTHKPFGQNMQQKTPDQFFSVQGHDFVSIVVLRSDLIEGDCFDLFWLKQTSLFHSLIAYNFQLLFPLISEYLTLKYQSPPSQYHLAND
jgi:hypothetical protein